MAPHEIDASNFFFLRSYFSPLPCPHILTARNMTSRLHCFVGGLSLKKADVYYLKCDTGGGGGQKLLKFAWRYLWMVPYWFITFAFTEYNKTGGNDDFMAGIINTWKWQPWGCPKAKGPNRKILQMSAAQLSYKMSDLKSHIIHGESSQNKDFRMLAP